MCDDYEVRFNCCKCIAPTCNKTCDSSPPCQPHQVVRNTSDPCCPEKCVCTGCYHNQQFKVKKSCLDRFVNLPQFSISDRPPSLAKCMFIFFKKPGEEWIENCATLQCVSDGNGCYKISTSQVVCNNTDTMCPYYAVPEYEPGNPDGRSPEECCIKQTCGKLKYGIALADFG